MTEVIKETGIFVIVAEAMVYLSPSEVYAKYIKLIVGMVLIVRLAMPVLSLISGNGTQFSLEQLPGYETGTERTGSAGRTESTGRTGNTGRAGSAAETASWQIRAGEDAVWTGKAGEREAGAASRENGGEVQENPVQIQMEKEILQRLGQTEGGAQIREVKFREREDGSLYLLITTEEPERSGTVREEETDGSGKETDGSGRNAEKAGDHNINQEEDRNIWLQQQRQYFAEKLQMEISDVEIEVMTWE